MTLNMLPKLKNSRVHKSAMIDIGSIASLSPRSEVFHYSASKRFCQFYSKGQSLDQENNDRIDWILVRPAWVSTPMTGNRNQDLFTCTPADTVAGTLRCLGKVNMIYGSRKHEILGYFLELGYMIFGVDFTRFVLYQVILEMHNFIFGIKQESFYDRTIDTDKKTN